MEKQTLKTEKSEAINEETQSVEAVAELHKEPLDEDKADEGVLGENEEVAEKKINIGLIVSIVVIAAGLLLLLKKKIRR